MLDMPYMIEPNDQPEIINGVEVYQSKNFDMSKLVTADNIKFVDHSEIIITKDDFLDTNNTQTNKRIEQFVSNLEKSAKTIVYFQTNKAKLNPSDFSQLENLASYGKVTVKGYADPNGSVSYNDRLSKERAYYIAKWLYDRGIVVDKVEYFGERKPVSTAKEEYSLDRRVDIDLNINKGE